MSKVSSLPGPDIDETLLDAMIARECPSSEPDQIRRDLRIVIRAFRGAVDSIEPIK